jgi:hypothetical protein
MNNDEEGIPMSNIFKDSSAPYVLTLLVSLLGWMFNTAIKSGENIWVVHYEQTYETKDGAPMVTVFFENKSLFKLLNVGTFTIECADQKYSSSAAPQCFTNLPNAMVPAVPLRVGNVSLPSVPQKVDNKGIKAPALLPPGGKVGYRIGLVEANTPLRIGYTPDAATAAGGAQMLLTDSWSPEGFVFANYLRLVGAGFIVLLFLILVWFVNELVARWRTVPPIDPEPNEKIEVTLTIEGQDRETNAGQTQ